MDFKRHPPMVTPLLSAAALMVMGGFLMNRIHPGGLAGALRGEKVKQAKVVTVVPAAMPDPDPVAWGDPGLLQVGLEAPLHHETVGPIWLTLRVRNSVTYAVRVAAGVKGATGAGKVVAIVTGEGGRTVEWAIPDPELAFCLRIPAGDEAALPFRLPEPPGVANTTVTNVFTVRLALRGISAVTDTGVVGPLDAESGGIVLTRCWSLDAGKSGGKGEDDGLGLKPGDIAIPVRGEN